MSRQIFVYDTTLRDGTQREGISLSCDDKLRIAQKLDDLGVAYIEGGWPGSNPKDMQFFDLAKRVSFKNARLVAFGSTRKPNIQPHEDENLKALIKSKTPAVAIFGKSWDLHVRKIMNNRLAENIAMIADKAPEKRSSFSPNAVPQFSDPISPPVISLPSVAIIMITGFGRGNLTDTFV